MNNFSLKNKNIIITGGGGLLAKYFSCEIIEFGGNPILVDLNQSSLNKTKSYIKKKYKVDIDCRVCDLSLTDNVSKLFKNLNKFYGIPDALINNAAHNPSIENLKNNTNNSLETFDLDKWNSHISSGLTSAFLCTKYFGQSKSKKKRSIINISSDLGLIAPNQSLYSNGKITSFKPVSYSVVKHGIIGLTKYTSTYYLKKNIRCNAVAFGGVYNNQDKSFLNKIEKLIPLGRMARKNEYNSTIVYLLSNASSYMNGSVLVIDGGRTSW